MPGFDFPSGYTAFQFVFVLLQASAFGGVFTGLRDRLGLRERLLAAADAGLAEPARDPVRLRAVGDGPRGGRRRPAVHRRDRDRDAGRRRRRRPVRAGRAGAARQLHGGDVGRRAWRCGCARSRPGRRCRCRSSSCCSWRRCTCRSTCCAGWVEAVAHVNPFTALVEGGRDFISGQDFDVWLMFGIAIGLGAVFLAWAVRGVHRAEMAGQRSRPHRWRAPRRGARRPLPSPRGSSPPGPSGGR